MKRTPLVPNGVPSMFVSSDFDIEDYVKELTLQNNDPCYLVRKRKDLQIASGKTAQALKKNVFNNYTEFIQTSKEISNLESDMYDLRNLLGENKEILEQLNMLSLSKIGSSDGNSNDVVAESKGISKMSKSRLLKVYRRVEGAQRVLAGPNSIYRYHVMEGDLLTRDPETFKAKDRVMLFLLSDSLIVGTLKSMIGSKKRMSIASQKDDPGVFEKEPLVLTAHVPLNTLAVVDVKDTADVKNAFKVTNSMMFEACSLEQKTVWLERIMKQISQQRISEKARMDREAKERESAMRAQAVLRAKDEAHREKLKVAQALNIDWLLEMPDDLDVLIAQRDLSHAVQLIEATRDFLKQLVENDVGDVDILNDEDDIDLASHGDTFAIDKYESDGGNCVTTIASGARAIYKKMQIRLRQLADVLTHDLVTSMAGRSVVDVPVMRRNISLLIRLGYVEKATMLFLQCASAELRQAIRRLKSEGTVTLYVQSMSHHFFLIIRNTCVEFEVNFSSCDGSQSSFVAWVMSELDFFASRFHSQVFNSSDFSSIVASLRTVLDASSTCSIVGLDLNHLLLGVYTDLFYDFVVRAIDVEAGRLVLSLHTYAQTKPLCWFPTATSDLLPHERQALISGEAVLPVRILTSVPVFCTLVNKFVEQLGILFVPSLRDIIQTQLAGLFKCYITDILEISVEIRDELQRRYWTLDTATYLVDIYLLCLIRSLVDNLHVSFPNLDAFQVSISKTVASYRDSSV